MQVFHDRQHSQINKTPTPNYPPKTNHNDRPHRKHSRERAASDSTCGAPCRIRHTTACVRRRPCVDRCGSERGGRTWTTWCSSRAQTGGGRLERGTGSRAATPATGPTPPGQTSPQHPHLLQDTITAGSTCVLKLTRYVSLPLEHLDHPFRLSKLFIPKTKLNLGKRAIPIAASTIWNQLPTTIKSSETVASLRKK